MRCAILIVSQVTVQCRGMSKFRSTSSSTKSQDRMTNSSREESGQMRLQVKYKLYIKDMKGTDSGLMQRRGECGE